MLKRILVSTVVIALLPGAAVAQHELVCDPAANVRSYVVMCDGVLVTEVNAQADGSLLLNLGDLIESSPSATIDCTWSVRAQNPAGLSLPCNADDTDCDGDIDGADLNRLIYYQFDVKYFADHYGLQY